MDDMQDWEIYLLLRYLKYANKNQWEQTRMIVWASLCPYLKGNKTPNEILPLPFDFENNGGEKLTLSDKERIDKEMEMSKKMADILYRKDQSN